MREGGSRRHRRARCRVCTLHEERCLCASLQPVESLVPLVVVQHADERNKPTNTARLLVELVRGSRLLCHGDRGRPLQAEDLEPLGAAPALLYPGEGARMLGAEDLPAPTALVVLDGTWRQASRMSRRVPGVSGMEQVTIPPGALSSWVIRRPRLASELCTFEATARALAVLHAPGWADSLIEAFARVNAVLGEMKAGRVE